MFERFKKTQCRVNLVSVDRHCRNAGKLRYLVDTNITAVVWTAKYYNTTHVQPQNRDTSIDRRTVWTVIQFYIAAVLSRLSSSVTITRRPVIHNFLTQIHNIF
jgi:hypothetical protein